MKILVLSCSTGGGHNACGHYIAKEFNENNITCDFVDYFSILGEHASEKAEKIYVGSTKGNGGIFKSVYKLGELYSKTGIPSPVYGLNKLAKKKILEYIEENKYTMVIAPHIFPAMAVTALKEDGEDIKLINVATDYRLIPFWEETKPDYFVIPHESLKDDFMSRGFKEDTILPFGISVASSFKKVKKDLDLPKDKDIILLTSGSMGFGNVKDIVKELLTNLPEAYLVVICGSNENLYLDLVEIKNPNLCVKGFVNNMNEYMYASTVILTKPGGLSSTEAAIMNKPMVHIMPIPGVENYNANFFAKNGLSLISNSIEEVVLNTKKILEDKKLQEEMIKNQKRVINANSAKDLVHFVKENFM